MIGLLLLYNRDVSLGDRDKSKLQGCMHSVYSEAVTDT